MMIIVFETSTTTDGGEMSTKQGKLVAKVYDRRTMTGATTAFRGD